MVTPPYERLSWSRALFSVIPRSEATWESVPLFHASGGLFSFSSERKEEKKRRQKLRFWISLRGFTRRLSCLSLSRERCAVEISPKYCIAPAPLSAAAFALKCKTVQFYIWCVGAEFYPSRRFTAAPSLRVRRGDAHIASPFSHHVSGGAEPRPYTRSDVPCERPLPLPLGEVAERSEDGEGKP